VQSRNVTVEDNSLYNVGLGIFVRGSMSFGNRIAHNNITAGMNGAIGICYNPAPGDPMAPRGDVIYANHVAGYATGIQMAASSPANVIRENTVAHRGKGIENANITNMVTGNIEIALP
jgi:Periplasmic copper-binding protein (NosD)